MSDALNYMVFDTNKLQIIEATIVSVKHSLCVNGIKLRYVYLCRLSTSNHQAYKKIKKKDETLQL